MSELVRYEIREQVAIITVDNPPVNALSPGVPEAIEAAVARAAQDDAVRAVVLIGAGSTFIAGAAMALEMCTLGQHIPAGRALAEGMIDRVIEGDLLAGAIAFARGQAQSGGIRKSREQNEKIADRAAALAACAQTRDALKKTARGARAPYAAVDAIQAGIEQGFDAGSAREIEIFADCVLSTESRAMVQLFFAEREIAKIPDVPKDTPTLEIRSAALVGAGTMGGGTPLNYAHAGT